MTTNDSTPNVPTPIDPASRIALAVLAMFFDERHAARDELAEECRNADDSMYPEQKAIADTWRNVAGIVWELLGGRPDADQNVRRVHSVEIGVSELGKLIAMATARQESPANECSNAERTQYELTIEQQKTRIADLERRNDAATLEEHRLVTDVTILRSQATVDAHKLEQSQTKVRELQSRISELTKVPVVDGLTPIGIYRKAHLSHYATFVKDAPEEEQHRISREGQEIALNAVLRVFVTMVLQRVRDALDANDVSVGGDHRAVLYPVWTRVIDEELAALTPTK